ncbi:cysteine hydrolase family protein [Cellulomonas sp. CW35]|uniref:cysteine hydrolase family protein n=1 Tax=Cellulomonas TaxID=1707 RepID=UPI001F47AFE0|nr:cysteine hydrolase family protein [Cellulomonas palmilytica]UJP38867.1 cysteine hydrolase [Cellulomonas palmilytica]
MTTFDNRPGTALLVIDVQNAVVAQAYERDAVLGRIASLVTRARQEDVPVVWVQHQAPAEGLVPGEDGWQIVPEVGFSPDEARVDKQYGDSFEDTPLESLLAERGVGHLVVAGAQSDACIRSTIHGAFTRGYDVTLVADAHTTEDLTEWGAPEPDQVVSHTNLYWSFQSAPGRTAAVVPSDVVAFAAP